MAGFATPWQEVLQGDGFQDNSSRYYTSAPFPSPAGPGSPKPCHAALCIGSAKESSPKRSPALGLLQARVRTLSPGPAMFKGLTSRSQENSESGSLECHSMSHGCTSLNEQSVQATSHALQDDSHPLSLPLPILGPCMAGGSS